jgi:hypothetical protein
VRAHLDKVQMEAVPVAKGTPMEVPEAVAEQAPSEALVLVLVEEPAVLAYSPPLLEHPFSTLLEVVEQEALEALGEVLLVVPAEAVQAKTDNREQLTPALVVAETLQSEPQQPGAVMEALAL